MFKMMDMLSTVMEGHFTLDWMSLHVCKFVCLCECVYLFVFVCICDKL